LTSKCWNFTDKYGKFTNNNCDARHVDATTMQQISDRDDFRNWIAIQEEKKINSGAIPNSLNASAFLPLKVLVPYKLSAYAIKK